MPIPIPVMPPPAGATNVLRPHELHVDLRPATPMHHLLRNVHAISTSSTVWVLIFIAVWASVLGLAALSAARRRRKNSPDAPLGSVPGQRN